MERDRPNEVDCPSCGSFDPAGQTGNAEGWADISLQELRSCHTRRETAEAT